MLDQRYSAISQFLKLESAGGILLMASALLAILIANSALAPLYDLFVDLPLQLRIGALDVSKPLLLWINDGLMAIFFFLVGMELKREVLEGELSDRRKVILPCLGAVGGMAAPAVVYLLINDGDSA
ncbi:MAG: Na+/H+ antiporter NhaA, partial [Pseudohongiella sp.]|nr:Na+/H+ antiporter NhaA [Pseudohongiella sp.]